MSNLARDHDTHFLCSISNKVGILIHPEGIEGLEANLSNPHLVWKRKEKEKAKLVAKKEEQEEEQEQADLVEELHWKQLWLETWS